MAANKSGQLPRTIKRIRVAVSLCFFILILLLFLDIKNYIPEWIIKKVVFLQFVPSFIDFLSAFSILSFGFVIVLFLTVLFGRVYCSFLCPLGTLQDVVIFFANKLRRKKKRNLFSLPFTKTRFIILLVILIPLVLFQSVALVGVLEPYSIFGRISNNLIRPIVISVNNGISSLLSFFDIYSVYPYEFKGINVPAFALAAITLFLILYLSVKRGRLYCNTVCPVGTLLGLISRYSLYRFKIKENLCKSCSLCERVCKAECIDSKDMTIDMSRCVGCFNCLSVCSSDGVVFERRDFKDFANRNKQKNIIIGAGSTKEQEINLSKREFLEKVFVSLTAFSAFSFVQRIPVIKKLTTIKENRFVPVVPPGAKSISRFNLTCTACNLCVKVCPTQVLQPSFLEYGAINMFQPRMDYLKSFCNYDCNSCMKVCPTGALELIPVEQKKLLQIGKAKLIKENCIVFTEETECGACSEHCPTKAVDMIPYKKISAPEINENYCIGCGACEKACPTKPYKSIYVVGNKEHKKAQKNLSKQINKKFNAEEDFPF